MEQRIIDIEIILAEHEKTIEDLNEVVIKQAKIIDALTKQNRYILDVLDENGIKPLSEETPPPHY